jgi:hypothetical protein
MNANMSYLDRKEENENTHVERVGLGPLEVSAT